jgi:hypothetical protein
MRWFTVITSGHRKQKFFKIKVFVPLGVNALIGFAGRRDRR